MDHPLYGMMDGDEHSAAAHANGSGSSGVGVLQEVLAMCGVSSAPQRLPTTHAPFVLAHPPHRVRLILESELPRGSDRITPFIDELTEQCSETEQLRRFISPTVVPPLALPQPPHTNTALLLPRGPTQQDSIIRILLSILTLQRPLIDWLLEHSSWTKFKY